MVSILCDYGRSGASCTMYSTFLKWAVLLCFMVTFIDALTLARESKSIQANEKNVKVLQSWRKRGTFPFKPATDIVVPLRIVVTDNFSTWRNGEGDANRPPPPSIGTEGTESPYAIDVLNNKLPPQLRSCYKNMTQDVLTQNVYSPAAFGEKLCGNLVQAEYCAGNATRSSRNQALLDFRREAVHIRMALCDPECPFAQAESCKTKIVNLTSAAGACRASGEVLCADAILADLQCKPEALAVIYWQRSKILAELTHCEHQSERCIEDLNTCLAPVSDYLKNGSMAHLCREKSGMEHCIQTINSCNNNKSTINNMMESVGEMLNKVC